MIKRTAKTIPASAPVAGFAQVPGVDEAIVSALRSGECTLFAGSGVSAQAGLPVWPQTLSKLIDVFETRDDVRAWQPVRQKLAEGRLDTVTDLISSRVPRPELLEIFAQIYEMPVRKGLPTLSRFLTELPFARVLTSN